ncbi:MAG: hypothetical protein FVQ77_14200 [Cytophagales bacterium]|nr:hypothetical protein [Cytophagales bacterium]
MLLFHVFKLNALFTFEFFVLICAILLLAYVNKQQLSKWYKWGAGAISVIMVLIIICTAVNAFCGCHKRYGHEGCSAKCYSSCCKAGWKGKYPECKGKYHKDQQLKDKVDEGNEENVVSEEDTGIEE